MLLWFGFCGVRTALSARARSPLCLPSRRLVSPPAAPSKPRRLAPSSPHSFAQNRVETSESIASHRIRSLRFDAYLLSSPRLASPRLFRFRSSLPLFSSRFSSLAV
jgi:hypothetical protein